MIEKTYCTAYYRNPQSGVWWFRVLGYGLCLYAPWKPALFSERYGYRKMIKFRGWRVGGLKP